MKLRGLVGYLLLQIYLLKSQGDLELIIRPEAFFVWALAGVFC